MQIWVDVYDASGNRLGDGPVVSVTQASIVRSLDGAGSFKLRCMGTDPQALTLLTTERRVKIWAEDTAGVRLLGEGIIRKRTLSESPSGVALRVDGPDILDELKRRSVLLARIYNQQTVSAVASGLIALVPGWSVSVDASISSNVVDARYDGVSILKAFQNLAKQYGYHLRTSATASKTVEIGPFGTDNGLRLMKVEHITQETLANPNLLMVQQISQGDDTEDLCNWLIPMGAGEGEAALTLEKSTRTTPYTIQTTIGPDGSTLYYISDSTSITANGEMQKVGQFKELAPLSNSETDIVNAANALYDAAVEWLLRHIISQEVYKVTVKNVKESIKPGDKIHINYKAQIESESGPINYLDIRDDFWVMRVNETVGLDSSNVDLEISNIDRYEEGVAETVIGAIEAIELRGLKPAISSSTRSYVYPRIIASGFSASIPVEFTDATYQLQRIRFRLKTRPFRATATAAASGGGVASSSGIDGANHSHVWGTSQGADTPTGTMTRFQVNVDTGVMDVWVEVSDASKDIPTSGVSADHSHTLSIPAHTHPLTFGIVDDTDTPRAVTVWVNGVNKTFDLFGSSTLAPSGGNLDVLADMGELTNTITDAAGGLRQEHTIEIRCNAGQGRVEATVEIFEVTQAIKLS